MSKIKNKLNVKSTILLSVIGAVVIFTVLFLYSRNTNETKVNPTGEPVKTNEEDTPVDLDIKEEVKDGVYTNYTYGFRFEYDDQKFNDVREWKRSTGKNFYTKGWTNPSLNIKYIVNIEIILDYDKCLNAEKGEIVNEVDTIAPTTYEKSGIVNGFCVTYVKANGLVSGGYKGWSYTAIRKNDSNDSFIYIAWKDSNPEDLKNIKPDFYSLLESFSFIN